MGRKRLSDCDKIKLIESKGAKSMNIPSIVKALTNEFNTNDPFQLAASLGVKVLKLPLGNLKGFYKCIEQIKFIFINSNLKDDEQKIVCAHELGHAIMHSKVNCCFLHNFTFQCTSKIEIEANRFCAYLLITDEMIKDYEGLTYSQISQATYIPLKIVELRQAQEKMF